MDEELAKLIIAAGFFVGLAFWLIAFTLYRRIASAETLERFETKIPDAPPAEVIRILLADGKPLLTEGRLFSLMAPRVTRPADNRLIVDHGGIEVRFEATRAGGGSLLVAEVDSAGHARKYQLGFGVYVLIVMPLIVGGLAVWMWNYVAASAAPAVRWQSLQIMQICHFLWPPFLFYFNWKVRRTQAVNSAANLLVFAEAAGGERGAAR
jgi:hypothetical protein